jgi:hypothetical protein
MTRFLKPLLSEFSFCNFDLSLGRCAIHRHHGVVVCSGTKKNIKAEESDYFEVKIFILNQFRRIKARCLL